MSLCTIPCVLFAGGKSSRMGEDKAFLPFGGSDSLIEYQIQRLKEIFARVYISAKDKTVFDPVDAIVIEDIAYKDVYAPTAGFFNIYRQLKAENMFFVLSVDAPFVNKDVISKVLEVNNASSYDAIIVRTSSGIHPLCGIYTRKLEEPMQLMMEKKKYKLTDLLDKSNVFYVDVEDDDLLLNLNTPKEYQKALKIL